LNRVELAGPGKPSKIFDLSKRDRFWAAHRGMPFPEASQAVESEITAYKVKEQAARSIRDGPDADAADNVAHISNAVRFFRVFFVRIHANQRACAKKPSSLPELLEQKKNIDMHTVCRVNFWCFFSVVARRPCCQTSSTSSRPATSTLFTSWYALVFCLCVFCLQPHQIIKIFFTNLQEEETMNQDKLTRPVSELLESGKGTEEDRLTKKLLVFVAMPIQSKLNLL
jgi:hypothetical protein